MIEQAVYEILSGNAGVTALVGARVYPYLPQNVTFPCVGYGVAEQGAASTFSGQGTWERVAIEVDAWADTYSGAIALAGACVDALKNYGGAVAGITIDQITVDGSATVYEDDAEKYRKTLTATLYRR